MVVWWLCWHRTIFTVSTCAWFRETVIRRGLCTMYDQSPSALCLSDPVARDRHAAIGPTLAGSMGAVQSCLCSLIHISTWLMVCLQHLVRPCSGQFRSTSVLPINHVIQMPWIMTIMAWAQIGEKALPEPNMIPFVDTHTPTPTPTHPHTYVHIYIYINIYTTRPVNKYS